MRTLTIAAVLFVFTLGTAAQDLNTVIAKSEKAIGAQARKMMPNLNTSGYFVLNESEMQVPFKILQARPDKLRVETTIMGFKALQTYDGTNAWLLTPTQGLEAKRIDPRDMAFISAATYLDGPFRFNKNEKFTLKYLGYQKFREKSFHLVMWSAKEERLKYFINPQNFLIDAVRYEYKKNGGWYSMEYEINSYMDFQKAKFPGSVTAFVNGIEMVTLTVNRIKTMENLDMGKFGKPSF